MPKLIGITGRARSGKDTLGKALEGQGFQTFSFARALKEVTALIAREHSWLYFDDKTKEEFSESLGMPRREALQKVGSAVRDSLGKDTWVNRVIREWKEGGMQPTVITDVRYDNEALAVRKAGGIVAHVTRPDNVGLTGSLAAHESEAGVREDLIDVFILNDREREDLMEFGTEQVLLALSRKVETT